MTILFFLFFILLMLIFARQAWCDGVLIQYWGMIGVAGGMVTGFLFFKLSISVTERLDADIPLPLGLSVFVSGLIGLVAYFIVRGIAKVILCKYFGPDSSLNDWTDGWRGAVLSLLPSVATVVILASGLRLGGTLMELRHLEYICRPTVEFPDSKYPSWPVWTKWRNSIEAIPLLADGLSVIDPISRVPERRIVCLLVASKHPELLNYLQSESETAPVFDSIAMREAKSSDNIADMLKKFQHVSLIRHPLINQAARDLEATKVLEDLELQRMIDAFMLSPDRQERIKSAIIQE